MEDHEEIFINPICAVIIVLGIISITGQLLNRVQGDKNSLLKFIMKFIISPLSTVYAVCILFVGSIFTLLLIGDILSNPISNLTDLFSMFLMVLIFAGLGLTGFLNLNQLSYQNNRS